MRKLYSTFRTMSLILGGLVLSEQALAQQNVQGHEYVDLGLPSGLLWATCNVGATAPEQYGDYLAWGEISNKSHYSWQSYQLGSGMDCDINKYMSTGTDYVLPIEDDVASQRWGEDWYVPSWEQYCELQIRCTWRRRYLNGVFGVEGTGPNGNTIFFPFAGAMNYGNLEHEASYGTYWTSYINPTQNYRAGVFFVASTNDYAEMWDNSGLRYIGNSVRAVCNATENEGKCGDNLTYSISDDYAMHIDGNGEMYDYYNYRNYNWARIKRVIVSEGVTSIGSRSFRNCTNLETVEFPSSLQAIYSCAFEGCSKLVDIKIPNSVTIIGADAFNGCKSLTDIIIPSSVKCITERTFAGCTNLSSVRVLSDFIRFEENPFENCTALKSLYVGANPGSIYAHYGWPFQSIYSTCTLYVPEGSKTNYQNADWWGQFQNIEEYPEISVAVDGSELRLDWGSRHQKTLSAVAFYTLSKEIIEYADWSTSSSSIFARQDGSHGENFRPYAEVGPERPGEGYVIVKTADGKEGHSDIIKVYGDHEGIWQSDNFSFETKLKNPENYRIEGPYTLTISGSGTLPNQEQDLTNVYSPNPLPVEPCNTAWFYDTEVFLGEGITSIGTHYFCGWTKMNKIDMSPNISSIGTGAFSYCTSLKSIEIPSNVKRIGDNAFEECTSLTSMFVSENIAECTGSPFASISNTCTLYVPKGYKEAYQNAPGWKEFQNIIESDGIAIIGYNSPIPSDMKLVWIDHHKASCLAIAIDLKTGEVLNDVEWAGNSCVWISEYDDHGALNPAGGRYITARDPGLATITVRTTDGTNRTASIDIRIVAEFEASWQAGDNLFCELKYIGKPGEYVDYGPYSLTITGYGDMTPSHFEELSQLRTQYQILESAISLPEGMTSISAGYFTWQNKITTIDLPSTIEKIDDYAFYGTGLTSITLPSSVKTIGNGAFDETRINTVICNAVTPPSISEFTFSDYATCELKVPCASIEAYRSDPNWSKFGSITVIDGHSLVEHASVAATCTNDGSINYWTCSSCKKYFADAEGNEEITIEDISIPALGHDIHCVDNNNGTHTSSCSRCDYDITENCEYVNGQCIVCKHQEPTNMDIDDTDISKYDDVLYIPNTEVATGQNIAISILLKNQKVLTGFQCDLVVSDGFSFVFDEYGFAEANLIENRISKKAMTFETETQSDGSLRLLAYSSKNIAFAGNDGEVAYVTLHISSNLSDGEYPILLKNIVLTEASGQTTKIDKVKSTITVITYTLGDANGDGEVNVGDLAATASYILGNPPANFVFKGADANEDNEINVGDLAKIAGIILGTSSSKAPKRGAETEASFDMNMMLEPMSDNSYLLHVGVDNMGVSFSGFQFDLNLPDGLNVKTDADGFAEVMLSTDRTNSRKTDLFDCNFMEDGKLRVLCASSHNALFEGESGEVATILLEADSSFDAQGIIALRNIVYTATGEGEKASDVELNIANAILSIEMLNNSTIVTVYNMNGSIVKRGLDAEQCLENLPHGIYVVDGKKVVR